MALISPYRGVHPILDGVLLAENATVVGDVEIGIDSSVWYGAVIRADVNKVRIGRATNIQDLSCIHMTGGLSDSILGDEVTVGHSVVIHGAIIEDGCLIGMGSIVMDNARIGEESIVGAGTLITGNTIIPPRSLVLGRPGKVVRVLSAEEAAQGRKSAKKYVGLAHEHWGASLHG